MAEKKLYGLLGKNIGYSLSPAMHNAAFKHFGIDAEYRIFDKNEDELEGFFKEYIVDEKLDGLNITIPYKMKIREIIGNRAKKIDGWSRISGAVNTIKIDDQGFEAYNTDGEGFWSSLVDDFGYHQTDRKKVFVMGAGGAGSIICFFLAMSNVAKVIYVYDIALEKPVLLEDAFYKYIGRASDIFFPIRSKDDVPEKVAESDLFINATHSGTNKGDKPPIELKWLTGKTDVYDLVYSRDTELVTGARAKGLRAFNGLGMLVGQGAWSFKIWNPDLFTIEPGKEDKEKFSELKNVMRKAAEDELAERNSKNK